MDGKLYAAICGIYAGLGSIWNFEVIKVYNESRDKIERGLPI